MEYPIVRGLGRNQRPSHPPWVPAAPRGGLQRKQCSSSACTRDGASRLILSKIGNFQNPPRPSATATQQGSAAPNQGRGRYFGRLGRPGSHPSHPQSLPPKSLRILLWASRFSKNRSIFGLVGPASSASATPGPKPPNKGWGRTFMDAP